jgi:phenylacetate-CoA ligase
MRVVRGTNVYPRAIEEIMRHWDDVEEFQVRLYTADGRRDEIEVLVEFQDQDAGVPVGALSEIGRQLAEAHEGLRFGVRLAEVGSLPRFELKTKRLVDERSVWGSTTGERKAM